MKLFLKGDRCLTEKCAFNRRGYAPGQHGERRRRKVSEFGLQLAEKQKIRRYYGVLERQFRRVYGMASDAKGITGHNLLAFLESRLDNVVYRLGFAASRNAARQLVRHGHIAVNGEKTDIPSYVLRPGQVISVRDKSRKLAVVHDALATRGEELAWLRLDKAKMEGELLRHPDREEIPFPVNEQLVVELYSR
jgi:small subunit ribosomal protein S4